MKLNKVIRLDSMPIGKAEFTEEGYLIDKPILTTTGIFEYVNNDGSIRRELRLAEDVFDGESLASYKGKPIIITHDAGLITKDNVAEEQIGTILTEGYQDGKDVRAEICIHDTNELKECGLKELSLGYSLDLDETPGQWKGQKYDAIQRNIRINHLALVREARAGESARLNLDSRDNNKNILVGGKKMAKKSKATKSSRLDGILSEKELEIAIKEYKARRAQREASQNDDEDDEDALNATAVSTNKAEAEAHQKAPVKEKAPSIEHRVKAVKESREKAIEEDEDDANNKDKVIAQQDEDIDTLFDIIDTLLAEKEFDACAKKDSADEGAEEDEDIDYIDEENEFEEDEEDEFGGEDDEEDEFAEDEDDEEVGEEDLTDTFDEDEDDEESFEDEKFEEDEDDEIEGGEVEEFEEDEDDDDDEEEIEFANNRTINADSIDAIVRTRVKIGLVGKKLNLDGLEDMSIKKAKCKIIKAVRPNLRLDGKSPAYINAAYEMALGEIERNTKQSTVAQKKQMFNKKTSRNDSAESYLTGAQEARLRMINRKK